MAADFKFFWALMDGYSAGAVYPNEDGFQATVAEWLATNSISLLEVDYCHIYEEIESGREMVGFMIGNNLPKKIDYTNRSMYMHEVAIEFLSKCDQQWEGDDSGVAILQDEANNWDTGVPGDFVVCRDGVYSILRIGGND